MSADNTFTHESNASEIEERDSRPSPTTLRQRLQRNNCDNNLDQFQEAVLSILMDIQSKQDKQLEAITADLVKIKQQNADIQKTQKNLEEAVRFTSSQYDDIVTKIGTLEDKIKESTTIRSVQQENSGQIYELQSTLEEVNRKLRERSVEIRNIPYTRDENKTEVVKRIYKCLSLDFSDDLVTDVSRVSTKDKNNKPLIVEMNTAQSKAQFMGSLKNYNKTHRNNPLGTNKLGFAGNDTPVYASDYLTPHAAKLYYLARNLKRHHNYKYCWSSNGKIYVKKHDDSSAILLKTEAQVEELKK